MGIRCNIFGEAKPFLNFPRRVPDDTSKGWVCCAAVDYIIHVKREEGRGSSLSDQVEEVVISAGVPFHDPPFDSLVLSAPVTLLVPNSNNNNNHNHQFVEGRLLS